MPAPNGYEEENYRNNNKTCNVRFGAMLLECKDFFFNSYSRIFTTQNFNFFLAPNSSQHFKILSPPGPIAYIIFYSNSKSSFAVHSSEI